MCGFGKKPEISAAPQIIAAPSSESAARQGDLEARMRRARAGAATSILTSPVGIPAKTGTTRLGAPA